MRRATAAHFKVFLLRNLDITQSLRSTQDDGGTLGQVDTQGARTSNVVQDFVCVRGQMNDGGLPWHDGLSDKMGILKKDYLTRIPQFKEDQLGDWVLDGVIWQPNTIYNLAETTLITADGTPLRLRDYAHLSPEAAYAAVKADAVKTVSVTTGLDRGLNGSVLSDDYKKGSFTVRDFPLIHGEQGVKVAENVDRTYYWRDFVYYAGIGTPGLEDADDARILTDAKNRVVREFGLSSNANVKGNIYAVEIVQAEDILGGDPPYYDPSIVNRGIAQRLMRPLVPHRSGPCGPACGGGCGDGTCSYHAQKSAGRRSRNTNRNLWVQGYGTGGNFAAYQDYDANSYRSSGLIVGLEREYSNRAVLGCYYSYGVANSSIWHIPQWEKPSFARYENEEHRVGAYLRKDHSLGHTIAMAHVGYNDYKSHRGMELAFSWEHFNAKFGAVTAGAYLEHGADFLIGRNKRTTLTPFGALQYSQLRTGYYTETSEEGPDLVQTAKWNYRSLRSLLGVRTHTRLNNRWFWNNRFHWEHELLSKVGIVKRGYLEHDREYGFQLESNYGGRDWFVLGTGLEWELTKRLSINAGYDVMFKRMFPLVSK